MSKAVVVALTLAMNAAMGLVQFGIVAEGSTGAKVAALVGALLANALALFGQPVGALRSARREAGQADLTWLAVIVAAIVLALAMLLPGCGLSHLDRARMAVTAAAGIERTAAELLSDVDAAKQEAIGHKLDADHDVDGAKKARDEWRGQRVKARQAILAFRASVAATGAGVEVAGLDPKRLDLNSVLRPLVAAYTSLREALLAFGVALPAGVL